MSQAPLHERLLQRRSFGRPFPPLPEGTLAAQIWWRRLRAPLGGPGPAGPRRLQPYTNLSRLWASQVGSLGAIAPSSPNRDGGSLGPRTAKASSTLAGPSQARARMTCPAGPPAKASCQEGACRSSMTCLPTRTLRLRPEVRYAHRTGTCTVSPSAFAAAAPLGTMVSPRREASARMTYSTPGASTPKRPLAGRR